MRRYLVNTLLASFLVCAIAPQHAIAEIGTRKLDLASYPVDQVTTVRLNGGDASFKVELVNVIPRLKPYPVNVTIEEVPIPPLVSPFTPPSKRIENAAAGDCPNLLKELAEDLEDADTEIRVKEIGDALGDTCGLREEFRKQTTQLVHGGEIYNVRSSESVTFTIIRGGGGATWTIVFAGTPRGEWRTSYGFFFVPDRDERWYTKETKVDGKPSTFTIEKQADREEFDFVPTVLFTFLPSSQRGQQRVHGLTAGLGYDLEKPFVFGGYSLAYNENVIFSAGLAFHRQSRLRGRYSDRPYVVSELLEPEQLVEDTYGPNVYLGVGFRFGDDVHARRIALEKETAKAQREAAAAKARAAQAEKEAAIRVKECEARANAAEEAAKAKCTDEACRKVAEADAAAAKAKCPLTELERELKEEEAAAAKKVAEAAKTEKRKRCEEAATTAQAAAVAECAKDTCKKKAEAAFKESMKKCLED